LKEEKLEQLRIVFKNLLKENTKIDGEWNLDNLISKLLYEVKIRGNDRKE